MATVRIEISGLTLERKVTTGYDDLTRLADALTAIVDAVDGSNISRLDLRTLLWTRLRLGELDDSRDSNPPDARRVVYSLPKRVAG